MKEIKEIKIGLKLKQKRNNPLPGINDAYDITLNNVFEVIDVTNGFIYLKVGLHLGVFKEEEVKEHFYEVEDQIERSAVMINLFGEEKTIHIFTNKIKRTVVAVMNYDGIKFKGIAKCMEEDVFSNAIGEDIAVNKMLIKFYNMYKEKINKECIEAIIQCNCDIAKY